MALKVILTCSKCKNKCKQQVDEKVWKNAEIMCCPVGNKYSKK